MPQAKPSPQQVRDYMQHRATEHKPPPSLEEIRRRMGWGLVPENGTAQPDEQ